MPFVSSVRGNFGLAKRPFPKFIPNSVNSTATGGTITTAGGYKIHTFTTTGADSIVFAPIGGSANGSDFTLPVELLMIAGGGGGGSIGGGGGAGGYIYGSTTITSATSPLNIGAGGNQSGPGHGGSVVGTQGGNSTGFGLTAIGGGFGCGWADWTGNSGAGGSSGGGTGPTSSVSASQPSQPAVAGITQVGHAGSPGGAVVDGPGLTGSPTHQGGGGGGAGAVGNGRGGGLGLYSSITGTSVGRGGGGGGGVHTSAANNSYSPSYNSDGIPYGGAQGAGSNATGTYPGTNGTGGGGGGGFHTTDAPCGGGGSGIIVVRYTV